MSRALLAGLALLVQLEATAEAPPAIIHLPAMDAKAARVAADRSAAKAAPLRFARPHQLHLSPAQAGRWTREGRTARWKLVLSAPGATDINIGLRKASFPNGASLTLTGEDGLSVGPFDAADLTAGQLWTPPVPGETARIEVTVPAAAEETLGFVLTHAGAGFRDVYRRGGGPGLAKQGFCNIDVTCPEAEPFDDEIRAVAAYTINGVDACTGTLIMDAEGSFRPWFLTAFHCRVSTTNAPSVVTLWNYESPACGQLGGGSRLQSVSGARLVAAREDVDFALLELSARPPTEFDVHFAGWDRTDLAPATTVGIHHPGVDEKAIAFDDDAPSRGPSCIVNGTGDTHWYVGAWERGTTERGSSGSALLDAATGRVIGLLSGGAAACSNRDGFDCYGRLARAWSGGTNATQRLEPWLDPAGSDTTTIDGSDLPAALQAPLFTDSFEPGTETVRSAPAIAKP
ncbi:MAG: hypothetical protein AAGE01_21590 [Pseudomonadota bacterium]